MTGSDIRVTLTVIRDHDSVAALWCELEARSRHSYFISWAWIGTWLRTLPSGLRSFLLQATSGERVVGLALLVARDVVRHGFIRARRLFLHETGDPHLDELTIEFNGLLVEAGREAEVTVRCLEYLAAAVPDWDELMLSGLERGETLDSFAWPGVNHVARARPVYYVDLGALRAQNHDYLAVQGKGIRYKIRRALREYESCGPIRTTVARDLAQAEQFFAALEDLHQARWTAKGMPGSFANSYFKRFHTELVRSRFESGEIQLMEVMAGKVVIGYLYNLVHRGYVYAYQCGLNYAAWISAQSKPGVVCDYQAIEYNRQAGADVYELMAGDSQHKRRLSTHSRQMHCVVLQRDRLRFRLERSLKRLMEGVRPRPATTRVE